MAPKDLWTQADLDLLVKKREIENKKFIDIALEMNRPEGSCWRRYTQIAAAREPAPSIVPEPRQRIPFHRQMGIETYVHLQAVLWDPAGRLGNKRRQADLHTYRMPITLAKVFA